MGSAARDDRVRPRLEGARAPPRRRRRAAGRSRGDRQRILRERRPDRSPGSDGHDERAWALVVSRYRPARRGGEVSFAGTPRFQPPRRGRASSGAESVLVRHLARSGSRGRAVAFEGKVGHFGARIPAGGKLIELQVREGGVAGTPCARRFIPTRPGGSASVPLRALLRDERPFVFRIKIAREQGWPYKAPGRSPSRTVTVVVANR